MYSHCPILLVLYSVLGCSKICVHFLQEYAQFYDITILTLTFQNNNNKKQ